MSLFYTLFATGFGLIIGSYLTSYTYRFTGIFGGVIKGRSRCPKCKKIIAWYDNIPVLSFSLLKGRCRNCGKKISLRYPLTEFFTALCFVSFFFFYNSCPGESPFCSWSKVLGVSALPFFFSVSFFLIAVLVIDFEHQIIPDNLAYYLFTGVFILIILTSNGNLYQILLTSFASGLFFLALNLITKGRGMGLGDAKLALSISLILGWPYSAVWIFLSFIIGAVFGLALIFLGKASFGKKIAFGPFLVLSFFLVLFFGDKISQIILPYL